MNVCDKYCGACWYILICIPLCLVLWNVVGSVVSQCIPQVQGLWSEVTKNGQLNIKISAFFKFGGSCQAIQRLNLVPVAVLPLPRKAGLTEFVSICRFHANIPFPFSNTQIVLLLFGSQISVPEQKKNPCSPLHAPTA